MDQMQKEESQASCWDELFLVERNSQKPSPSGEAADHKTNIPSPDLKPSHLNLLTTFGLSIEDLEELSHYPDDQLTPENMPVLFLAIQKRKLASKGPPLPLKSTEKATISTADGLNPTVEKTVIDYRHKSKYGYNEGPKEGNASSIAKDMSMEGCPTQQPESVPAMASSVISSPKNPTKELMRQAGSQASAPNLQASLLVAPAEKAPLAEHGVSAGVPSMMLPVVPPVPPSVMPPALPSNLMEAMNQRLPPFTPEQVEFLSRHCRYEHAPRADPPNCLYQTMGGQKTFRKAPEDPVKSPFGTVKASWLPDFSQTDKQKEKKLPTAPQMCDYYSVTPRIFPHLCSLCNKDCLDKDWTQHLNSLQHKENCRWLLWQYPDWTPKIPTSPKRYEDDRQERNESRQRSASPSPKRSRRSSSGHARHWSRSRSRSSGRYRTSRPRSRSPRCLPSPRHQSRTRSNSPRESLHSSRRSRSRSSGHHRTSRLRSPSPRHLPSPRHQSRSPWRSSHSSRRSRSRSSGCHRTSQPRSRSPRCLPSPRHRSRTRSRSPWQSSHSSRRSRSRSSGYHRTNQPRSHSSRQPSRSPQQSLPSGRWSQSSSSKERRSESSTKSTEDRYAKKPGSQKRSDERPRTHRSSGCREKGHEDLERTRQETPKQKLSANETGNQKQTRDKLVPGQSCEELERSALASLTEKSILQAMAQLQAHRTADGTLNQEPNSADLISVIQQVATQVITTVLDSREASTTQASTSVRDSASNKHNSVARKAKTQSVKMDSSLRQGTANTTKAERKSLGSPCPKKGTSLNSKAKAKNKAGLCPEKSSKAMAECADSSCIQQGTAASGKNEAPPAVAQEPGQGIASSSKAVNGSMVDLSPHAGTAVCSRNQDEAGCSLNEGTAGNSEAERLPVTDPVPSQGTVAGGKTENKCLGDPGSEQGIDPNSQARSQDTEMELAPGSVCPYSGEATVSSQPVSIKAETSGLAHPSPQTATSGPCKAKIRGVKQKLVAGSVPPRPGEAAVSSQSVNSKAEISGVSQPQAASPGPSKAKKRGVKQKPVAGSSPCPGETAVNSKPVSRSKAETSGLAGPSPQTATSGICKARNQGVKQKPVARSVPPCPGEAAVSSQTINSTKAETSPVAGQSPQPEKTPGPCKAKNQDEEQKVVAGSASFCSGEVAVSPQTVSSKLDTSGVARPSPQSATSGPCKAKTHDVQQKPVLGGEAVVSSQLMNSKAETSEVAGPSPQPGASKNQDVKQKFVAGHVPPGHDGAASTQPVSIRAETSEMAGPNSQLGTSGPCNAENRDVVAGNIPDLFKPAAKPRVWVCGGSLVVSAQKWDLQKRQFGQLDWLQQNITLEWHGQEDLTWAQLVATVQKLAAQGQAPDVLILHLGEKDLLSTPWPALSQTIRREVGLLKEAFPKVRLMWSEMLPQNIRPAGMEACNVEELLREANLVVGGFISGLGGMVIKHGEIANCVFTLNLEGGGLSYIGLDLFLEDIRNAVRAHVLQSSGAAGGGLQGGRNASPFASLAASAGLGTMSQEAAIEGNQTVSSSKEASEILRKRKQRKRGCEHRGKCDEADRKVCCELPAGFLGQPQEKNAETHIWKVSFQFKHESDKQGRQESRHRSASPSPRRSRRSSSGHARHRTRSQSRSSERHRTSRPRSRSPRWLPSPRHRSRSPRQSLHSSRQSQSSASKQRRAGSSAGLTEGQHAKTTCSKIKHDERKQTYRGSDLMSMIQKVATQGEEETCVVVISNLPEAGLSLDEISNLIKPFGGLKDVLILSSHKKAYLEVNQKSADSLVKFYASIPVWVETRQLSISMAPEFKDLKDEEAIFISMIKDANPKANVEALHAQFVHLGNLPDGGYSELEILCIGLRFGRVDHYVVISNKRKAILLLDSAKSAASMCRFLKNSPYSLRQSELTFSRSPKIDPLPGEEETCVVVISDLPEAGLSLDEISNLIKPFGELKDVLILSSHQKAYLEVSQRSADSLVKFYACIPVWVKTRQLCIRMVPEFMDLKDEEAIFISMIKDANPKVNVEALHAQLVHLGNLPDSGYTKLEILCIGLRFGRVDHYVVISNKRKAILQLDSAESAASMCRFLKSSPYSLRESELTFSRSPKIEPLPVEVTRKEVKKQEPSNESPDLKKIPEGSGLVHTASVPSAKPAEAKEEPICKLKVATAEVKKELSEKTECEALSKPSETATSEGKLAALTTEVGDLSSSELKSEKPVALASGLGEEEKVTDTALAEFLGNASPVATGGKDEESAGPGAELSEGLKGTAGIGGTGAGPAKTEQGVEAAPAICETVSLGSTEAPVEELSGEDLQSNTRLVPPGPGHADAPRNLAEMSTGEVEGMVDKEPENPSSATEGSMEVEAETAVPEPTEPAKEKPELQSGKAEAASEKQPEVLASNDKPAQEEKLERKADDRSPEQGLPKSQPRKEMGQGQPEGSRKGDVLATVLAPSAEATSVSKTILKALMSVPNISKKRTVTRRKEEQKPAAKPGTRSSTVAEKKPVPKEASQQRPTISRSKLPDSKPKVKLSSLVVKVGNGKSSSQQDKDSQVEPKGSSKQTQEQEARSSTMKLDSNKEKVFPGRNSRSSHRCTNPNEEEELFPFNLDEFVTVDEVTDEVDSPSQPRRNPLRGKRKDAAREPSSKRRKAKTSDDHGAAGQELSFVTLDEIGEDEGGMGQAAEHLEGMPDPQALVTVDEVNDEEELISEVAQDPQSLVTLDEISEQEDPAAHETMKETGGEPDLKAEPLVTVDEIGEVEELPLNELSHLKTETSNNRREEKQVLLDPGDLLSSQALEDPSTLFTVDEIHEDSENQPLVTLDEVTEEEDDFLEGEFNFVTVDEVGSEDEEEEKVTVTGTNIEELVVTKVSEKETAVAEPTECFPLADEQEETAILHKASPGEKACPVEDVPQGNKASEAQVETTEKENVATEIETQEPTSVEAEKGKGGEVLEQILKEDTEVEELRESPLAESTSNVTEQPENQGSKMEDNQQLSALQDNEEDMEAKAVGTDEGGSESASRKEPTGGLSTPAPALEASVGDHQTAGGEDLETGLEQLGQNPGGKEDTCREVTPSQSSMKPEKEPAGPECKGQESEGRTEGSSEESKGLDKVEDLDFLVPKVGFFCQICSCFCVDEPSMKSHCQSALHQQNKKKFMNKKAEEEEKKESDGDSAQESSR